MIKRFLNDETGLELSEYAVAAALVALAAVAAEEAAAAQAEYTEARRRAVGLEKLETRHDAAFAASELLAEQGALDEIASAAWHRKAGS